MNFTQKFLLAVILITIFGSDVFFLLFVFGIGYLIFNKVSEFLKTYNNTSRVSEKNSFLFLNFSSVMNTSAKYFIPLGIFLLFLIDGISFIPVGHTGVIFDQGRGVLEKTFSPGLNFKIPLWQRVTKMNTQIQTYTMAGATGEGDFYGDNAIEALTKDGQKVSVDITVQFFLPQKHAPYIYQNIGLDYKNKIVRPASRSVIRQVVTGYTSKELFEENSRNEASEKMREGMKTNLDDKKLLLGDVLLRNIQFSDIYLNAIEEKQIAEQQIQKTQFEKEQAEIEKEKTIIKAQAEAESINLKGKALKENPLVIQFEMVEKLSPNIKWGVLPDGVMPLLDLKNMQE
jgi:regulator of protease activity HflC (stomatin/prohibitin superfamily)